MMHGVLTMDDDDVVNLGEVSWSSSCSRRHVWKPKGVEVLGESVDGGNYCWRRNLLFATNCENRVDFQVFNVFE